MKSAFAHHTVFALLISMREDNENQAPASTMHATSVTAAAADTVKTTAMAAAAAGPARAAQDAAALWYDGPEVQHPLTLKCVASSDWREGFSEEYEGTAGSCKLRCVDCSRTSLQCLQSLQVYVRSRQPVKAREAGQAVVDRGMLRMGRCPRGGCVIVCKHGDTPWSACMFKKAVCRENSICIYASVLLQQRIVHSL